MWPPAISVVEILLLAAVAVVACIFAKPESRWLLAIVPCFAVGMVVTPADLGSTLAVGAVLGTLYVTSVLVSRWLLREPKE